MIRITAAIVALCLASAAAAQEAVATFGPQDAAETLVIRSTTDIAVFGPVVETFLDTRPGMRVLYEQWGSNDLAAHAEEACADKVFDADLLISSAIDLLIRLVNDGCAAAHRSAATQALPPARNWRHELFGVTAEPAVLIYNRELVSEDEAPRSRFDLIDLLRPANSRFAGKVATYDIEESGLGYLFAFVDSLQANTFGRLLEAFGRSGAIATCCSAEIIDAVARGEYLLAYNVLGSYALARAEEDPRIGIRAPSDYTLILSRAAMIPRQARRPRMAGEFIDFLLSPAGRAALVGARLIVRTGDTENADIALEGAGPSSLRPIELSPVLLAGVDRHKRRIFLEQWRANLLRQ